MLRIFLIPAILLALLGGAMLWSSESTASRADFAFVNRGDNISLDLNDMSYMQDIRLAYALWEGLYALDPVKFTPVPGTADSVQVSPDQRVWTLHIRDNARWSNGESVHAKDFIFAWRRMLESPAEYTYLHYYIKGAKKYQEDFAKADKKNPASLPDFATVGEQEVDPNTIRVTLTDPVPFFPALLAFTPFMPMHEPSMRKFRKVDDETGVVHYDPAFTRPPDLVTNGQYYLAQWDFKRRLRMIANDYYWNSAAVKMRVVDEINCPDYTAAYRLYQQGDVDFLADVDPDIAASLLAKPERTDLHVFTGFGTYFYELNCDPRLPDGSDNPLRDPRVRQALAMSIDKRPIIANVAKLNQPLATTYIPIGAFPGYRSPPGIVCDIEGARRLLADAGYPDGKGFPKLGILYNTTSGNHADIATIIRRQWSDNLHIDFDPRGEEQSKYKSDLHSHNFAVSQANWGGDYNDPSTFTDKYLSGSENNAADWKDDRYDKLCADAAVEADLAKRFMLLSRAEDRLLSEAPIIPLYTNVGVWLFHDNVKGIPLDALQLQNFGSIQMMPPHGSAAQ